MTCHPSKGEAREYLKDRWRNRRGKIRCPECGSRRIRLADTGDSRIEIRCRNCEGARDTSLEYYPFV